ncbi:type I restriction modification DNA specificity domain protein [Streptococcus infantis SK970]|nr:type I restriction modification DNA specificity domain protein [Streptococcus infantis SK970]
MEKPKIRFKSFEKRWESYRLSEYSNYRRGSFPQPYGNKEWYGGDNAMPFVQVVDVLENLRLVSDTKQKISTLAQPMSVFVPSDSVIVTLQGSIGRVAITQYDAYVDRTILIFEDYIYQTNKEFWAYTIRNKFEIERQKAPGGTIKTITKEALSDFKVSIPNYSEQSAIGSLFRTLDDLLSSYKDNLANYQSLKATILSKMFPKAGQTVPEIRLDGFEGEWENLRLGDCAIIKGRLGWKSLKQEEYTEVGPSMIAGKHIKNGVIDWGEVDHIPQWRYDESPEIMLENGDIIFSKDGSLGNPALVSNLKGEATINSTMMLVRLDKKVSSQFFYQVLTSSVFQKLIYLKVSGSSIPHLFQADMQDFRFFAPCIEEQQAIGSYFSNLDNLINSYQEKISQLETLKKKLLQDMFI